MMAHRFASLAAASDRDALAAVLGPVASVSRQPLAGVGFSGATHERLTVGLADGATRSLVLKHINLAADFTALRTRDRLGREAVMAASPGARVWRIFRSPYVGWAREGRRVAVLMDDVTEFLLPDERRPIRRDQEDALLAALARMHAAYWNRPPRRWTADGCDLQRILMETADEAAPLPHTPFLDSVRVGWELVAKRVPRAVWHALWTPASRVREALRALPATLVHGDAKVANFALRSGEIWAFDWALAAAAPASLDLGWYLAVNASRLTRSKEAVAMRYRALLEEQLGEPLAEDLWRRLWAQAVIGGARSLLWSKAAACERAVDGAEAEWEWWVSGLTEALR